MSSAPHSHSQNWPVVCLGDITTKIGSGATPTGGESSYLPARQTYAFVRSQNVFDRQFSSLGLAFISDEQAERLSGVRLQPDDLLLNITGDGVTFARACRVDEAVLPACVNQHVAIVRVDAAKASAGYVLAYLTHPAVKSYIESFNSGGSRRAVTKGHIESFRIPLPPLDEQERIAGVLRALDDRIELNSRMTKTLEAMARALFKSWFVDFDPVRAKSEGRTPAGMDAATAALLPDGFEESDLGEIPRGWRVEPLSEVLDLDKGVSYKGEFLRDDGVPMVNLGCFKGDGVFDESRVKGYAGEVRDRHWVAAGDLVIANTDMTQNRVVLGSPGLVPRLAGTGRAVFSHHVFAARFRSDPTGATKLYCYFALLQPEFRARAAGFASGTTVLALPRDAVLNLAVVTPPSDVRQRFAGECAPWLALKQANAEQSKTLATLRDLLLPKLLSGEWRVRDADRIVERRV